MLTEKTILVLEDAALIAVDIESVLGELGAARIVTEGGGDRRAIEPERFDLAIVDVRTAIALGEELIADLDREGVPIVFLTTDPDQEDTPDYSGRFSVVQKPFNYRDLCAAIAELAA